MPLTRGDKMIIIGAVALAATVVLGLAILKKPYLFTGSKPQPAAVAPPPVQVPAAVPPSTAQPVTPMAKVEVAPPVQAPASGPAPGTIPPAPTSASLDHPAVPAQAPGTPGQTMPADTTHPARTAQPQAATTPSSPGDATLEQMFADLANDMTKPSGHDKAKGQGTPEAPRPEAPAAKAPAQTPESTPAPAPAPHAAPEPAPASAPPAKAEPAKAKSGAAAKSHQAPPAKHAPQAETKPEGKPEPKPTKAASKPAEATKPAPKPAAVKPVAATGNVLRIVAEEKPGEYMLLIETNKAPAEYSKMFLTDPPRMVVDISGSWRYNGPLSSATGNDFIRHIRVGKHRDKFRVVLDMAPNATTRLRGAPTLARVPKGVELRIPK